MIQPEDLGLRKVDPAEIRGGQTVEESAKLFKAILTGKGTPAQTQVVLTNAAFALQCYFDKPFDESYAMAKESLESGKANTAFEKLIEVSKN